MLYDHKKRPMKKLLLCLLFASSILVVKAQTQFITQGKIEFEKKVNLHKLYEGSWMDNFLDKMPKFQTSYFNLYFKDGKTLYEKGKETEEKIPFMGEDRNLNDVVFSNLGQGTFAKRQAVFEENFLILDSIRHIEWRITNETRDIAGFECHKAVGIILDSVYVIAFYTDQVTASGGPLSFAHLPGMILGIAIPRLYLTLFATKLEMIEPADAKFVSPAGKLKKTDYKTLTQTLQKAISDWGAWGRKYIMNSLL